MNLQDDAFITISSSNGEILPIRSQVQGIRLNVSSNLCGMEHLPVAHIPQLQVVAFRLTDGDRQNIVNRCHAVDTLLTDVQHTARLLLFDIPNLDTQLYCRSNSE